MGIYSNSSSSAQLTPHESFSLASLSHCGSKRAPESSWPSMQNGVSTVAFEQEAAAAAACASAWPSGCCYSSSLLSCSSLTYSAPHTGCRRRGRVSRAGGGVGGRIAPSFQFFHPHKQHQRPLSQLSKSESVPPPLGLICSSGAKQLRARGSGGGIVHPHQPGKTSKQQ